MTPSQLLGLTGPSLPPQRIAGYSMVLHYYWNGSLSICLFHRIIPQSVSGGLRFEQGDALLRSGFPIAWLGFRVRWRNENTLEHYIQEGVAFGNKLQHASAKPYLVPIPILS